MLNRLKNLLFGSLRKQLIMGMMLTVTLVMSVFVWDISRRQTVIEKELNSQQASALASSLATSSAVWVLSRDFSGLQEIVQGASRYPNLSYVIVLDLTGQVLAHNDPSKVGLYLADLPHAVDTPVFQLTTSLLDVISPIMLGQKQVGWVRIGLNREPFIAALANIKQSGFFYVLIAISLSVFWVILASRILTRRLYAIQKVADAVQTGESQLRVALSGTDEAARLAKQFNIMLDSLYQREQQLRSFYELDLVGLAIISPEKGWIRINDCLCNMLEYSEQELRRMTWAELTHPEDLAADVAQFERMLANEIEGYTLGKRFISRSGKVIFTKLVARCLRKANGQVDYITAMVEDVSEQKRYEDKLRLAANVFTHAREGIMITESNGTIIDVNETFSHITGYSHNEIIGHNPRILSSGRYDKDYYTALWRDLIEKGHWYGEIWNRHKNGGVYAVMQNISAVRDAHGNIQHYVSLFSDITLIKDHEQELEHIAHYDALTNLPNRVLLADRLQQAMPQAQRREQHLVVVFLDLDGFKAINDNHGHKTGDQLLMTVALRMKQTLREGDTLARLGGDEFVAVLTDLIDIEASVPMLTRLLAAAAQPVHIRDLVLQVSASLGATAYPQEEDIDADQLLRQADQAMYQAKLAGKNCYRIFDEAQNTSIRVRHESLDRIHEAIIKQEFVLHYQPKVNMRTGAIIGAEALIRWNHPEKGLLSPALFLPEIEDHPLSIELGEWVIDTALTQIELWRNQGLDIQVSVNIGARQLKQDNFITRLRETLAAHPDIMPSYLELEVLETSALENIAKASLLIDDCRRIGVSFALDDFGTGYSSLTYLKRLPVTLLKIDQSFVRDMLDDSDDLAIIAAVVGLARTFRRHVIAEGVETVEHGTKLLQLGCELAQGYGIARPMPADQLPTWSTTWRPDPAWLTSLHDLGDD